MSRHRRRAHRGHRILRPERPLPWIGNRDRFLASCSIIVALGLVLYIIFKLKDCL